MAHAFFCVGDKVYHKGQPELGVGVVQEIVRENHGLTKKYMVTWSTGETTKHKITEFRVTPHGTKKGITLGRLKNE